MLWLGGWGDLFAVVVWIERFIRFRGLALWFNVAVLSICWGIDWIEFFPFSSPQPLKLFLIQNSSDLEV